MGSQSDSGNIARMFRLIQGFSQPAVLDALRRISRSMLATNVFEALARVDEPTRPPVLDPRLSWRPAHNTSALPFFTEVKHGCLIRNVTMKSQAFRHLPNQR
jgi:hypothetical protein